MSTDILFVNLPPYESYYAEDVPHLGMLYVLTSLRHHGYSVGYLDCARRNLHKSQILDQIRAAEPRLIGFSVDTDNLFSVAHFTHTLKKEFGAELPIILGGPASQGQPQEIMDRSAADVLVVGEGEYTTREVADCLLRGHGSLSQIAGIYYRCPDGICPTLPRAPIADLDAVPFPDRNLLPDPKQYQMNMISGRGCPFKCTFCFEGRMGNLYRHRSPENIVGEIEQLASLKSPLFVCISDDTFTSDPEHTLRVCRIIRERFRPGKDLHWFCEVRVDVVARHPELVDALVEAGAARIQVGVESADKEVLRSYKRLNVKPEVVEQVLGQFHRAGLTSIYCGFILGGPHETMASLERTLEFARHLMLDVAPGSFECGRAFLTPLPGTDIREHPERYGIQLLDPNLLTSSNFNFCTTATETLSQEAINNFFLHFGEEMDRHMRDLIPTLPRQVLDKHARLCHEFGIATRYYERFSQYPRLAEYYEVVGEGKFESADSLPDDEILRRFPTRLAAPVQMTGEEITVLRGPTLLKLNGLGSRIFALCSGKLNVSEIICELQRQLNGDSPHPDVLRADVLEFVRHLDRNFGVFLKDF